METKEVLNSEVTMEKIEDAVGSIWSIIKKVLVTIIIIAGFAIIPIFIKLVLPQWSYLTFLGQSYYIGPTEIDVKQYVPEAEKVIQVPLIFQNDMDWLAGLRNGFTVAGLSIQSEILWSIFDVSKKYNETFVSSSLRDKSFIDILVFIGRDVLLVVILNILYVIPLLVILIWKTLLIKASIFYYITYVIGFSIAGYLISGGIQRDHIL